MKLGENILKLRKQNGLSQEQLGEQVGVTRQTISNWELNETTPNPEQLKLLSKALNVSIDELLDNDVKNVVIEKVSNKTLDSYGRQDLSTTGTGDGYYITNGYALPIKWEKSSRKSKTKYKYDDGKEVKINDGNTFVQIMPSDYSPTIN